MEDFKSISKNDLITLHTDIQKLHKRNLWLGTFFIVSLILIVFFIFWSIFTGKVNIIKETRIKAAKYNILKPTGEYTLILNQIKNIERGMRSKMLMCGKEFNSSKRLKDEEFEDYSTLIYNGKYLDDLNYILFVANTSGESCWNKKAYSKVGAIGLNQIMKKTFNWINEYALFKYKSDIYNVWDNTEASIKYWIFNRELMSYELNREPLEIEMAWAYNTGAENALKAIKSKEPEKWLAPETITHGNKVLYYYTNYLIGNYNIWWEEKYYNK